MGLFGTPSAPFSTGAALGGTVMLDSHQLSLPIRLDDGLHVHAHPFHLDAHVVQAVKVPLHSSGLSLGAIVEYGAALLALLLMVRAGRRFSSYAIRLIGRLVARIDLLLLRLQVSG